MARVLIISSFVAASRVGGGAQALALARLGIEPILIPTTLFGRHPGHGPPGGAPVAAETVESMLGGVEAQGLFGDVDAVITGYFASPDQVAVAAGALDRLRSANSAARIVVDPVIGDEGKGLYVREAVAERIAGDLVPRADLVTPNAFELAWLTRPRSQKVAASARELGRPVLVSSVAVGRELGVAYVGDERWIAIHAAAPAAPNGTGDLLTALFTAAWILGLGPRAALEAAASGVAEAVFAAGDAAELPLSGFPERLSVSGRVRMEALDG